MKRISLALIVLLLPLAAQGQVSVKNLPNGGAIAGGDFTICDQSGVTSKCTFTQDLTFVQESMNLSSIPTYVPGFVLSNNGALLQWIAAGVGSVTSVTCGSGLSGGTFSTTGTCSLSLPVATASVSNNVAGGTANQIVVQSAPSTSAFIPAPTTGSTFLNWNGSAFTWAAPSGSGTVSSGLSGQAAVYTATGNTVVGTYTPTYGASGTSGSLTMGNATSGLITLQPQAGALGSINLFEPALNSGTLVGILGSGGTSGDCTKFLGAFQIADVGAPCTSNNVGTQWQIAVYGVPGSTLSGIGPGTAGQLFVSGGPTLGGGGPIFESAAAASVAQFTTSNPVSGDCSKWSGTTGLLIDAGAPCSIGTVVSGTTGQGSYYASSGTTLSPFTYGNAFNLHSSTLDAAWLSNPQTGTTYTVSCTTDVSKLITVTNAASIAVTVPQATTTCGAGFAFDIQNIGTAGFATLTPTTSTINGAASLVVPPRTGCSIVSDGTNYQVSACTALLADGDPVTLSGCTSIGSFAGTAKAFTFIPGAVSCNVTATFTVAAKTLWSCTIHDRTGTTIPMWGESASTTTTATIPIPAAVTASTDTISGSCTSDVGL